MLDSPMQPKTNRSKHWKPTTKDRTRVAECSCPNWKPSFNSKVNRSSRNSSKPSPWTCEWENSWIPYVQCPVPTSRRPLPLHCRYAIRYWGEGFRSIELLRISWCTKTQCTKCWHVGDDWNGWGTFAIWGCEPQFRNNWSKISDISPYQPCWIKEG